MATYSGISGQFAVGGVVDGSPLVNGTLAAAGATLAIDAATASLYGVLRTGDTFALNVAGTVTRTVTGGPYVIASGSVTAVTFSPALTGTATYDNVAITYNSNSVGNITRAELNADVEALDATAIGTVWRATVGGRATWTGRAEAWIDTGDAKQAALVTNAASTVPTTTALALVLKVGAGQYFYGSAIVRRPQVVVAVGPLTKITFDFTADGSLLTRHE